MPEARPVYLFLDESGGFNFSRTGSAYFLLTCLTVVRPFAFEQDFHALRCERLELGEDAHCFHAAEDSKERRAAMFELIRRHLASIRIDTIVVQKNKTNPALRDETKFYGKMIGYLLKYVFASGVVARASRPVIITDRIPVNKKRKAVEKAIKTSVAAALGPQKPYGLHHFESQAWAGLQVVDYASWAIWRKWVRTERYYYEMIRPSLRSEFNVFAGGNTTYY